MKPLRLYIKNFMCHEYSYIDFTKFSSALIVGKIDGSDLYSNGVGKSSIFKSIEYVLFNQSDINLEEIIREGTHMCTIVFDFMIDDKEYRVSRSRTKKTSDLCLFEKISDESPTFESSKTRWKDISGSRAKDTERDLNKFIKINYKLFINTVHFMQNDFSGSLATSSPEKRKDLLKDALSIAVYSKLEKIAKENFSILSKDIDKTKILIDNIGDLNKSITELKANLLSIDNDLMSQKKNIKDQTMLFNKTAAEYEVLKTSHKDLENTFKSLVDNEKNLLNEIERIKSSITNFSIKKQDASNFAKKIVERMNFLKEEVTKFDTDFTRIKSLDEENHSLQDSFALHKANLQNLLSKIEELKIPIPNDSVCKHCRQVMTLEHKEKCQENIDNEIASCQNLVAKTRQDMKNVELKIQSNKKAIIELKSIESKIKDGNNEIALKSNELMQKKSSFKEFSELVKTYQANLLEKESSLSSLREEIEKSSIEEANKLKNLLNEKLKQANSLKIEMDNSNVKLSIYESKRAVTLNNIEQKVIDQNKQIDLSNNLISLKTKAESYPSVIEAFSTKGIPNLIIQNVLDDLQIESNNLLNQIKPALQLSFVIEKTKADGSESETLDIKYFLNGKERQFNQLSGAMKLSVIFSLKLGLSSLLQKMMGTNISFLMLDEIDQCLDKAGVDAFADFVKHFQKYYSSILVITHNERLKDKFSHAILVNQNSHMVSTASVVDSW